MPETFEVGVVGAGVAGSICARVLGKARVSVALIDYSHPREKPCGGLVEQRVVEEFNIPDQLLQNEVKWILAERYGLRTRLAMKPPAFLVSRREFDYHLLQEALKNRSVAFFEERVEQIVKEDGWILKTDKGRNIKVKLLIGADGCPSLVRKEVFAPIPPELLSATFGYDFSCPNEYIERTFFKNTAEAYYSNEYVKKGGFVWVFPKKNTVNVGIGGTETGRELAQSLKSFILSHPAGHRLRHLRGAAYAHLLPVIWRQDFYNLPCAGRYWAVIGDAAGHVNAVNGAGIYYAMKGGALCASAILNGDLRLFDRYWREEYADELCFAARTFSRYYGKLGFFLWLEFLFSYSPFGSFLYSTG